MADSVAIISPGSGSSLIVPNCLSFAGFSSPPSSSPYLDCGFRYDYDRATNSEGMYDFIAAATNGGYLICDGDGGGHFVLIGLSPAGASNGLPSRFTLTGNFWGSDGAAYPTGSFSSTDGPVAGEWGHFAACFVVDGGSQIVLTTYWNGLLCGRWLMWSIASGKTRKTQGSGTGAGALYIGAGSHNNFTGRLAAARSFDRKTPIGQFVAFIPPRVLGGYWGSTSTDRTSDAADHLIQLDRQASVIADLSVGFDRCVGGATRGSALYNNPGKLTNWYAGQPTPVWTYDSGNPYGQEGDLTNAVGYGSAANPIATPTLPGSARIFDAFNRAPQDWFWQRKSGPDLGSTDSRASRGALTWQQHMIGGDDVNNWTVPVPGRGFAIRNGFVRSYESQPSIAYVDNGQADMDIRFTRMNTSDMGYFAFAYRIQDRNNFWALTTFQANNGVANNYLYLCKFVAGSDTLAASVYFGPNATFLTARVVVSGNTHTVYCDDGVGGWVNLGNYVDATYNTQTKVGVCTTRGPTNGGGSNWAGTNFTVL